MIKETYFLSAGEVNAEGELSLPLLTSKIIEIATADSNGLGVGNPSMSHLGCGWVLSRLTIEMREYPKVNTSYTLTTWVEDWNRHFSTRCFRVDDHEGRPIGYARSIWMVMDTQTHENRGLDHLSLPEGELRPKSECPIERQRKHLPMDAGDTCRRYRFKYCDIDFYRHVNTVRYVELLLNGYSLEEMDSHRVGRIELSFLHEGHYGTEVEIRMRSSKTAVLEGESYIRSFTIHDPALERDVLFARLVSAPRN